jgi:aspartate/methionine/tyrosine aminotransferase
MRIETFAMERMQSTWENRVAFNLSESGVRPMRLTELVGAEPGVADLAMNPDVTGLLKQELGYTQSNGTPELRRAIAEMYPGATEDHVEVTNGGSEANYIVLWNLIEPGDDVVMMVPNYMQGWGLTRAFGATVKTWPLVQRQTADGPRWRPDLDQLTSLVTNRTKLIAICNPNNPTAARFEASDLDAIAAAADRHGAWVLADEIYRGAEPDGRETASIWGRSERVIVTSGLSKAYGLPGLRVGWIVAPPSLAASFWSYHDYTTIAPGAVSDLLARMALEPRRRAAIIDRTRRIIRSNYPVLRDWLAAHGNLFHHVPPEAGAIAFVGYRHGINSTELVTRLRDRHSVLIVPGDHFHMDGYLRIGFGYDVDTLNEGLRRLDLLLETATV